MNGTDTMSYEAKKAKRVFLYPNGATFARPKCMVVNERQIRDFSSFLSRVTSGIRAPRAVRNIYTPNEGHRVHKLDQLQTGHYYVAGGTEGFKKIKYGSEPKSPQRRPKHEFFVPHRTQNILYTGSKYKMAVEKPCVIHVFRNGDEKYRGARILLPRKIMGSWERVLELVTEKAGLITPAKRICTLDGRLIHSVAEIQDGGKYVVMEGSKPFQRVAYCATGEKKTLLMRSVARAAPRLRHKLDSDAEGVDSGSKVAPQPGPTPSKYDHLEIRKRKRSIRPMAGRKNKEGREKAVKDHREDSIFGGSPGGLDESTRSARMPSPPLKSHLTAIRQGTDSDREDPASDQLESSLEEPPAPPETRRYTQEPAKRESSSPGGAAFKRDMFHASSSKPVETSEEYKEDNQEDVFRASSQRDETRGAETIAEGGETEVEKPVDQEEAEEVAEEEEDGVNEVEPVKRAKDAELKAQPVRNKVDLSMKRTNRDSQTERAGSKSLSQHSQSHTGSKSQTRSHAGSRSLSQQSQNHSRSPTQHSQSHLSQHNQSHTGSRSPSQQSQSHTQQSQSQSKSLSQHSRSHAGSRSPSQQSHSTSPTQQSQSQSQHNQSQAGSRSPSQQSQSQAGSTKHTGSTNQTQSHSRSVSQQSKHADSRSVSQQGQSHSKHTGSTKQSQSHSRSVSQQSQTNSKHADSRSVSQQGQSHSKHTGSINHSRSVSQQSQTNSKHADSRSVSQQGQSHSKHTGSTNQSHSRSVSQQSQTNSKHADSRSVSQQSQTNSKHADSRSISQQGQSHHSRSGQEPEEEVPEEVQEDVQSQYAAHSNTPQQPSNTLTS